MTSNLESAAKYLHMSDTKTLSSHLKSSVGLARRKPTSWMAGRLKKGLLERVS